MQVIIPLTNALLRWPWVSYSCWAWSAVIVTGGCRCRCRGTADFSSVFWCVGVKSDSGRRDSNPGSERSQPKMFFFFFLSLFISSRLFTYFFTSFFFQNKRWILIVGWYRQEYRYATVRRSHKLLHSFLSIFLRLLLLNKIKLSRCCAVLMYDFLIYVLKAWTQKQDS